MPSAPIGRWLVQLAEQLQPCVRIVTYQDNLVAIEARGAHIGHANTAIRSSIDTSNVLMVQNERDPGTPLAGARRLRAAFGDRAPW